MRNFIIIKHLALLTNRPHEGQFCNAGLDVGELGSGMSGYYYGGVGVRWHSCGLCPPLLCPPGAYCPLHCGCVCVSLLCAGPSWKGVYKKAGAYLSGIMFTRATRSWTHTQEKHREQS